MTGAQYQLWLEIYKQYNKYQYDDFNLDEKKFIDKQLKKYIIKQFNTNDKLFGIFKFNEFNKLESFNINVNNKSLYFDRIIIISKIKDIMKQYNKLYVIDEIKYFLRKSNDIKVLLVQNPQY